MIAKNFEEYKQDALKNYSNFKNLFSLISKNDWASQIDVKSLDAQAKSLEREKFTLMVVGEAKSGKSSFINAYLKTDLLPVSTEQCTSAIITIHYAEKESLTYYTAGGDKHKKKKYDSIRKFLELNASLREKYRRIPVAILDDLVAGWGKRGLLKNGKVPGRLVDLAIDLTKDDIGNCPKDEYEGAIRDYLEMRSGHWKDIIESIEIGYPFSPEMKDVCIVDSPGVNARGGVGDLTEKKIKEANAVVFIKCAVGQDLESKSFHQFMNTVNAGWHEESLFLLLSRFGDLQTRKDKEQKLRSAKQKFKDYVGEERIVPIDSKVQWYLNKFKGMTADEIDAYVTEEAENEDDYGAVSSQWFIKRSLSEYFAKMEELAGFRSIDVLFDKYAKTAHCVTLANFLSSLHDSYVKIQAYLSQDKAAIQDKISCPPDQWKRKIEEKKKDLETLQAQVDISLKELKKNYNGPNGLVNQHKNRVVEEIKTTIDEIDDYNLFRKIISQITTPLRTMKQDFFTNVINDCNEKLSVQCDTMDFEDWKKAILVQNISEAEVDAIVNKVSNSNDVLDAVDEGTTFSDIKYYFNPKKCLQRVKINIKNTLDTKAATAVRQTLSYVDVIIDKYKEKLNTVIGEEQKRYDKLLEDQRSDKELAKEVAALGDFLDVTATYLKDLENLRREFDNREDGPA